MLNDFYSLIKKNKIGVGTKLRDIVTSDEYTITNIKFDYAMIIITIEGYLNLVGLNYNIVDIEGNTMTLSNSSTPILVRVIKGYTKQQNENYDKMLEILEKVSKFEVGQIYKLNDRLVVLTRAGNDWVEVCNYTKENGIADTNVFDVKSLTKMFVADRAKYTGKNMDKKDLDMQYIKLKLEGRI